MKKFFLFLVVCFPIKVFAAIEVLNDGSQVVTQSVYYNAVAERYFDAVPYGKEGFSKQERWFLLTYNKGFILRKVTHIFYRGDFVSTEGGMRDTHFNNYNQAYSALLEPAHISNLLDFDDDTF